MRVKFFAYIRDYTGCKEADVPYSATVRDLARMLSDQYGKGLRDELFDKKDTTNGEHLSPTIIIMVNGRHVAHLGGIDATLKADDVVQIFPLVAGG
jgi:molybdopterin synthase sulfur carrier subunit